MICPPCRQDDHWNCPDVVRAKVVEVTGRGPGKFTGRIPTEEDGFLPVSGRCECQHYPRGTGINWSLVNPKGPDDE